MADVLQFDDLVIARKRRTFIRDKSECAHAHVTMDPDGEIVTCDDCSRQLSAFWVLDQMRERWERVEMKHKAAQAQLQKDRDAVLHLSATRKLEDAWRSRKTVPACPHCSRGILPTDGLGDCRISREIEMRRRAVEKEA